jgi:hypothetical protein
MGWTGRPCRQLGKTHRLTHELDRQSMQAVRDRHSEAGFTTLKLNVTAFRQCSVINWPTGSGSGCVILKNRSGSGTLLFCQRLEEIFRIKVK